MLITVLAIFALPFLCFMAPLLMPGPRSLVACGFLISVVLTWGLSAYARSGDDSHGVILVACIAPLLLGISMRSAFLAWVTRGRRIRHGRAGAT